MGYGWRRILWWIILILTIAAAPGAIVRGWFLLNYGSEHDASEFGVWVGFCLALVALGLKLCGQSRDSEQ
jgi:high-affinity Fe2+/Pb2+ permease